MSLQLFTKLYRPKKNTSPHFHTMHRPILQPTLFVSSSNIAQIPSEDPASRAIGGCRLS